MDVQNAVETLNRYNGDGFRMVCRVYTGITIYQVKKIFLVLSFRIKIEYVSPASPPNK